MHRYTDPARFTRMVDESIDDELAAVAMYSEMARIAENPTMKALLMGIAGDEYGHARTFMVLREHLSEHNCTD